MNGRDPVEKPYIVMLDLNMPRMNGLEFLEVVRNDSDLRRALVFVLTTSDDDQDKFMAYENHVAGYVLKSDLGNTFLNALETLDRYWRVVEFPTE